MLVPTRRRRARGGQSGQLPGLLAALAAPARAAAPLARERARSSARAARTGPRGRCSCRRGIGRVPAGRAARRAARRRRTGERDQHRRRLHVADRARASAGTRACRGRGRSASANETQQQRDAGEARRRRRPARTAGGAVRTCGSQSQAWSAGRRKMQRERVDGDDEQRDDAEREQRHRLAGELLLGRDLAPRHEALACDQPAARARASPKTSSDASRPPRCAAIRG